MATDLVKDPIINHTFIHDLESAFYIIFWLSIRLLPNSWTPQKRALVMCDLFNPLAFSNVGTFTKKNWMAEGVAETSNFHIIGNTALTGLILSLLLFFQARHVAIVDKLTAHIMFGP